MIILLSPAKRLDYSSKLDNNNYTFPEFIDESNKLMDALKKLNARKIQKLMNINPDLAELNYDRFQNWKPEFDTEVARQAILAFKGDAYLGLNASSYSDEDFEFLQKHVRILSGLHGILKPMDLIRPYRLEMGSKLKVGRFKNLYDFWSEKISKRLAEEPDLKKDGVLINLASAEYFKVVKPEKFKMKVITPVFKEFKNGEYRPIHIFLKKARGMMVSFIVKNRMNNPEEIKLFDREGYSYNDLLSTDLEWVFTRG